MNIYLDIETIPTQIPTERERVEADVHPPGNYSKPETIEKWWANQGAAAKEEAWLKTALSGDWGEVVCVGLATDIGEQSIGVVSQRPELIGEREVLIGVFSWITQHCAGQHPTYIGHNIGWDLRFLHHRAIVHGVGLPANWPHNAEPWQGRYHCTQYEWAGRNGHIKLTELCRILGIEVHDEIEGSEVWRCWNSGELGKRLVIEHCKADTERVRAVWRRLRPQGLGVREVSSNAGRAV